MGTARHLVIKSRIPQYKLPLDITLESGRLVKFLLLEIPYLWDAILQVSSYKREKLGKNENE